MSFQGNGKFTGLVVIICLLAATCRSAEISVGEPLGEALFDLSSTGVMIGHDLSGGSRLTRTDVFKLRDGRMLAISSTCAKVGQPFSVRELRIAADIRLLTKETPL